MTLVVGRVISLRVLGPRQLQKTLQKLQYQGDAVEASDAMASAMCFFFGESHATIGVHYSNMAIVGTSTLHHGTYRICIGLHLLYQNHQKFRTLFQPLHAVVSGWTFWRRSPEHTAIHVTTQGGSRWTPRICQFFLSCAEVKWHVVARWRQVKLARAILMTPAVAPWFSHERGWFTSWKKCKKWLGDDVFGKEMGAKHEHSFDRVFKRQETGFHSFTSYHLTVHTGCTPTCAGVSCF